MFRYGLHSNLSFGGFRLAVQLLLSLLPTPDLSKRHWKFPTASVLLKKMRLTSSEAYHASAYQLPLGDPYSKANFHFKNFRVVLLFYTKVFTQPNQNHLTDLASGCLAGVVCAIVSQPGKSLSSIANEVGILTLTTESLGTTLSWWALCSSNTYLTNGGSTIQILDLWPFLVRGFDDLARICLDRGSLQGRLNSI